jgi:hypothetical protein
MSDLLKKIDEKHINSLPVYFKTMDAIVLSELDRRAFLVGESTIYDGGYFLSNRHYKPLTRVLNKTFSNINDNDE